MSAKSMDNLICKLIVFNGLKYSPLLEWNLQRYNYMRHLKNVKLNGIRFWAFATFLVCAVQTLGFADPEVAVVHPDETLHPGDPYEVVVETTWVGDVTDYAILPAKFDDVEWGSAELVRVESFRRGETNVVAQTIVFTPDSVGEYTTPEVVIPFVYPEAATPTENVAPGTAPPGSSVYPTLVAKPFLFTVHPDRTLTWFSSGLGALFLIAFIGWFGLRRWRRKEAAPHIPSERPLDLSAAQTALHAARKHRLDGDYYAFYTDLNRVAQAVRGKGEEPALTETLSQRAQQVGYGGKQPTDDEMDGDFREVERVITKLRQGETA